MKSLYFCYKVIKCESQINQRFNFNRILEFVILTLFFFPTYTCHTQQLPYVLSIEYDTHQGALLPPQLNIPAKGLVPDKVETFTVHLPCTGNISVEVPIAINLYVKVRMFC